MARPVSVRNSCIAEDGYLALILGIDPGSRTTGFGIINMVGQTATYVTSGCIRCGEGEIPERLTRIFDGIDELIETWVPQQFAIERAFMGKNADSALKLGQARGVALVVAARHGLPIYEYAPRAIKQAVSGSGNADKEQIQHMMKVLLKLPGLPQVDAADALAVAVCHGYSQLNRVVMAGYSRPERKRLSQVPPTKKI